MTTRIDNGTQLFEKDYVIIKSNGDFYTFTDGEIIIYNDIKLATYDFKEFEGAKLVSCLRLTKRQRKVLRKNIREFEK